MADNERNEREAEMFRAIVYNFRSLFHRDRSIQGDMIADVISNALGMDRKSDEFKEWWASEDDIPTPPPAVSP
jgi:hypothetical protein